MTMTLIHNNPFRSSLWRRRMHRWSISLGIAVTLTAQLPSGELSGARSDLDVISIHPLSLAIDDAEWMARWRHLSLPDRQARAITDWRNGAFQDHPSYEPPLDLVPPAQ